jgi:hypothetical protein
MSSNQNGAKPPFVKPNGTPKPQEPSGKPHDMMTDPSMGRAGKDEMRNLAESRRQGTEPADDLAGKPAPGPHANNYENHAQKAPIKATDRVNPLSVPRAGKPDVPPDVTQNRSQPLGARLPVKGLK